MTGAHVCPGFSSQVELNVITGDIKDTEFGKFGGMVFELFYRVDLDTMA